ncbi:MAG: nucleotidyltransferase domain-containing protein [Persephonella sp.]|nr:MAG: nucleotidyltransferase domain-containing protein [Persephonella sp.]
MREKVLVNFDYKYPKIQKLLKEIIKILEKDIKSPFKLYIFGSFATGKASYFSDLDLALETKKDLPISDLHKIKEEIENLRTLRKIDFVYLNKAPENLKKVVKKEGVLIYGSER